MDLRGKTICIFGGTGFIGRNLIWKLAKTGAQIKIASRTPKKAYFLRPAGDIGQIVPVLCNPSDPDSVKSVLCGCDMAVNLIGILYERGRSTFTRAHVATPAAISEAAAEIGLQHLVHVSAINADDDALSEYLRSKGAGETAIRAAFPTATILRPSVLFGPDDGFFNLFAKLARTFGFLPLIGGGNMKFQPVYVGDVVDAIMKSLSNPTKTQGKTYELGGDETLNFKGIYKKIERHTGLSIKTFYCPWSLAKLQGLIMGLFPAPLITIDQIDSLEEDSIVHENALSLADLGIKPTAIDCILPDYLHRFQAGGPFNNKKTA